MIVSNIENKLQFPYMQFYDRAADGCWQNNWGWEQDLSRFDVTKLGVVWVTNMPQGRMSWYDSD